MNIWHSSDLISPAALAAVQLQLDRLLIKFQPAAWHADKIYVLPGNPRISPLNYYQIGELKLILAWEDGLEWSLLKAIEGTVGRFSEPEKISLCPLEITK
jgi:hypothetical protein